MNTKQKIVLIGINHAGTTAVKAILRNNPEAEVVAYDRNDNISFLGCGIALWVGREFTNPQGLFYATPESLTKLGAKINMKHEMISLDAKQKTVQIRNCQTNEIFTDKFDQLILAIGSWPILKPGGKDIPGLLQLKNQKPIADDLTGWKLTEGIFLSKLYQHAQAIIAQVKKQSVKRVVVVGAGYIGIELVEAFHKDGKEVVLIDFENRIMPRYYDPEFTNDLETDMRKAGIKLQLGETLQEFVTKDDKIHEVVTNKGRYQADMVIMAVGFLPNTAVLKDEQGKSQVELDSRGAIIVNEKFQTSNKAIYAIGDCINIRSNAFGKDVNIALATNAVRSGLVAGLNIIQKTTEFPGVQGTNAIAVFGWKLSATGLSEVSGKAMLGSENIDSIFYQDTVYPPFMQTNHQVKIKIIWNKITRKIIGAEIGSTHDHTETIFMFSLAIMKGLTIDELAFVDLYFLPHFNKPYNFVTAAALKAIGVLNDSDLIYPDPYVDGVKK